MSKLTTFTFGSSTVGKILSTADEIRVNSVDDGYSVLYESAVFNTIDTDVFAKNLVDILMKNLANCRINLMIFYHFRIYESQDDITGFDLDSAGNVISLHHVITHMDINDKNGCNLKYQISAGMLDVCRIYIGLCNAAIEPVRRERVSVPEPKVDRRNDRDIDMDYFEKFIYADNDDSKKSKKKSSKKKDKPSPKKKEYTTSKVLKAAKSPKKAYKRHGVIVCGNKSAIKKDEKIIKEFIKDFFPGNAEWKKKFRKDLLTRWMNTYVISVKGLKQVEKKYQNNLRESNKGRRTYGISRTLEVANRLMTVPIDEWNNPRR